MIIQGSKTQINRRENKGEQENYVRGVGVNVGNHNRSNRKIKSLKIKMILYNICIYATLRYEEENKDCQQ